MFSVFVFDSLSFGRFWRPYRPDRNFGRSLKTVSSTMLHRKIYTRRPLSHRFIRPLRYDVPVFVLSMWPCVIYTVRGDVAHEIPLKKKKKMKNPLNAPHVCPCGLAVITRQQPFFGKTLRARAPFSMKTISIYDDRIPSERHVRKQHVYN